MPSESAAAPPSVYPSKVDLWLAVVIGASLVVSLAAAYPLLASGSAADLAAVGLLGLVWAVVAALALPVRYTIGPTELVIQYGLVRQRVPYAQIRRVYPSRSILASPAWSLDRVAVEYREQQKRRPTVYISPVRKEAFLGELAAAAGLVRLGREWVRADPVSDAGAGSG